MVKNKVMTNVRVYDMAESMVASGYPMQPKLMLEKEFDKECKSVEKAIKNKDFSNPHIKRAIKLANASGGGHNQFLTGILVSFDLSLSNKAWVEAERYRFLFFVSSQSTMHRITSMNIKDCVTENVDQRAIDIVNEYIDIYNKDKSLENYRKILDNLPSGLIITARMTTNYRCLRNIYEQRNNHRVQLWRDLCKEIEKLPLANWLIVNDASGVKNV